ncbi:MAG: hypothetical protein LKE85_00510 [Lachnospiraceae bacterium]|jgi:hypothetical protein|nr:hypothetical protein [Lachnospiraceae bacterium]
MEYRKDRRGAWCAPLFRALKQAGLQESGPRLQRQVEIFLIFPAHIRIFIRARSQGKRYVRDWEVRQFGA